MRRRLGIAAGTRAMKARLSLPRRRALPDTQTIVVQVVDTEGRSGCPSRAVSGHALSLAPALGAQPGADVGQTDQSHLVDGDDVRTVTGGAANTGSCLRLVCGRGSRGFRGPGVRG